MRRVMALIAAVVLVVGITSPAVAAGPGSRVSRFVGHFDMVDWDSNFVGHVDASFVVPTETRVVPGTLHVTWASDNPIRESHAQLQVAGFGQDTYDGELATEAYTEGEICDYPRNGERPSCRPFAVIFQDFNRTDWPHLVGWGDPGTCCGGQWYGAGRGSFVVVYAGATDS